ncbi:MAG: SpoIID/LytB domain-containing protein [Aminipila sp.]
MKFTIKRILSIIVLTAVIFTGTTLTRIDYASATSLPEYIKIGLKYGNSSANQYQLVFENGVKLGTGDGNTFIELASFEDIKNITIMLENGYIKVIGNNLAGQQIWLNENSPTANCIMPFNYDNDGIFSLDGNQYRGGVMFNSLSGSLNVINYINLEEYLYGVINGELHRSNPEEALKAQAVAARSYAACKLGTHNSYGFDLCSTTHCQVYKGFNDEYPETVAAVKDTEGDTVNYMGKPVATFFYKNSGGYTQAAEDVWNGEVGYLKAVKDEYCPIYNWTQSYTFTDLSAKLSSAGYNVGTITKVSIIKRNKSGAVDSLEFMGTSGNVVLQKEKIRSVLGATTIKSTMFTFSNAIVLPGSGNNNIENYEPYGVSRYEGAKTLNEKVYVVDRNGISTKTHTQDIYVYNGSVKEKVENLQQNDNDSQGIAGVESVSDGNVNFVGSGYGHGVGMPQDSAVEMAKKGFTYKDILKYYYTDVTID